MFFALYVVFFKPPIFSKFLLSRVCGLQMKTTVITQCWVPKEHLLFLSEVTELVMVKSPENIPHMVPFIPPVIALYNFQVKAMNGSIGCLFPCFDAVTKELFMYLKFMPTLPSIDFIYRFTLHPHHCHCT